MSNSAVHTLRPHLGMCREYQPTLCMYEETKFLQPTCVTGSKLRLIRSHYTVETLKCNSHVAMMQVVMSVH